MASLGIHKAGYGLDHVAPALSSSMPLLKNILSRPSPAIPQVVTRQWPDNCTGAIMLYNYMMEHAKGNPALVARYREAVTKAHCEQFLA